jgi:ABC-2 type transport system permease protein
MNIIFLIAKHTIQKIWSNKATKVLTALLLLLIVYAAVTGFLHYQKAEASRKHYQKEVRKSWVNSPDKHPHRMAHYGFIAFRPKSALSIFDYGMESFTGNAVFLEAHKQNSTNFSEASLSTSMLRFGEISIAMVLQLLLPLFIFFIGFNCISADIETGTLKILLTQNATAKQILLGNILGVSSIALIIVVAAFLTAGITQLLVGNSNIGLLVVNFLLYTLSAIAYSSIAVMISAVSKQSKIALVVLLGIWLVFTLLMPRLSQLAANSIYPSPSKIAFETAIEKDIVQQGDTHNPDDKFFKKIKDSVLKANNATIVQDLSFNYGGFQMKIGEQLSAQVYNKHLDSLNKIFKKQIAVQNSLAFINPYTSIRQLSMALSQTDFETYTSFQQQAEQYRYDLAQAMNDLQIKLIPNAKLADTAKAYSIDKNNWAAFKDFTYKAPTTATILKQQTTAFIALLVWLLVLCAALHFSIKYFKAL